MVKLNCGNLLTPHRVYSEFFFNLNPSLHAVRRPLAVTKHLCTVQPCGSRCIAYHCTLTAFLEVCTPSRTTIAPSIEPPSVTLAVAGN